MLRTHLSACESAHRPARYTPLSDWSTYLPGAMTASERHHYDWLVGREAPTHREREIYDAQQLYAPDATVSTCESPLNVISNQNASSQRERNHDMILL